MSNLLDIIVQILINITIKVDFFFWNKIDLFMLPNWINLVTFYNYKVGLLSVQVNRNDL